MVDILGVTNDVPVLIIVPPVETLYQLMIPSEAVAPKVAIPELQTELGVKPVIVGAGFTVAIISVLVELRQFPFVAST